MSFVRGPRTPQQPTRPQKHDRLERTRLPMNSSEIGGLRAALHVIDAREDGRGQREDRPVAPRTAERQLRDGREKQQNGDHLTGNGTKLQPRSLRQNQAQLQKRRHGEADPADQPKPKITTGLITSKKEEQDQQDNE